MSIIIWSYFILIMVRHPPEVTVRGKSNYTHTGKLINGIYWSFRSYYNLQNGKHGTSSWLLVSKEVVKTVYNSYNNGIIQVHKELVHEEHPRRYRSFDTSY